MAIKTYSGAAGVEAGVPNTKLRAEQMKSEDGFTSLAVDLEALRGQIKDIIGSPDYKENISGFDVQLAELNPHLSGSYSGDTLKVKQKLEVTGDAQFKANIDVDVQATLASANVQDLTSGRIVVAGTNGELEDFSGLTFSGGELTAASATVTDLTATRVVFAGTAGALVDSDDMKFVAGAGNGLTLANNISAVSGTFSGDVTIVGDLLVQGNTVTVDVGTLLIEDKSVVIAKGGVGASIDGAGIFLGSEGGESIQWNHAGTMWVASDRLKADEFLGDNLIASRLAYSDADKVIQSVSALSSWVAGTANQITVTDDGGGTPDGTITLSLPQSIDTNADVEFDSLKLGDLTDNRLVKTDPSTKLLVSADIMDYVTGTLNQVNLTAGAFGNVVLSTPQDIHTGASPEFAALNLGAYGDLLAAGSDFKVSAAAKLFSADGAFGSAAGGTWTTGLALSKDAASWDALWTAYDMGSKGQLSLVEILKAAAPSTTKRLVIVKTIASAGPDFIIGPADLADFPVGAAAYQNGKADVFVNGQKQVEGPTADFEFAAAGGL